MVDTSGTSWIPGIGKPSNKNYWHPKQLVLGNILFPSLISVITKSVSVSETESFWPFRLSVSAIMAMWEKVLEFRVKTLRKYSNYFYYMVQICWGSYEKKLGFGYFLESSWAMMMRFFLILFHRGEYLYINSLNDLCMFTPCILNVESIQSFALWRIL